MTTVADSASNENVDPNVVLMNLTKQNVGRWASRYLLFPSQWGIDDLEWIWEEVLKEGTAHTMEDADTAIAMLFEEFGGEDLNGKLITSGVVQFLSKFTSEDDLKTIYRTFKRNQVGKKKK